MDFDLDRGACLVEGPEGSGQHYNAQLRRVDFLDRRVYERSEGVYYPSVTSILSAAPVDPFFLDWIKMMGRNADIVRTQAAREGTRVHEAMESLAAGKTIQWQDDYGNAKYSLLEWQMILRGADFFTAYKPKVLASEQFLWSDKYQYAGTTDLLCEMSFEDRQEIWLLDFKTSNHVSLTYYMQLAAYAKALEEIKGIKPDKAGILWLKASTRTRSKRPGVYQGEGWQIIFSENIEKDFDAFLKIYDVYKIYNPKIEPYVKSYPTEVSIN